jgi:hypothetical protein
MKGAWPREIDAAPLPKRLEHCQADLTSVPAAICRHARQSKSGAVPADMGPLESRMIPMFPDWDLLSDDVQLALSQEALTRAADTIARHAELLAGEMETGGLADRGGPDALRLLAAVVRVSGRDTLIARPEGHA